MSREFRLKIGVIICACLLSATCFAQEAETTAPATKDSEAVAGLPDNPEPQSSSSERSAAQQPRPTSQAQPEGQRQQGAPSLGDLGFPTEQTKPNPEEQAKLDKRSHMLKVHQRLGLITAVPLIATVVTGSMAGGHDTSSTTRDLHAALGASTAGLYIATASYAIFAPKTHEIPSKGPIRVHKALAWIHGPGMILTPVLGAMAFQQKSKGERVHGIASAHAPVAYITAIAYGAAIASVSFKF